MTMFSDELEMLVDAAIADGVITEKERAVLHNRAKAEGVDTDELDLIIDARLAKANKKAAEAVSKDESKQPAVTFRQRKEYEESPSKELSDKIQNLIDSAARELESLTSREVFSGEFYNDKSEVEDRRDSNIKTTIESFAIPENPEDLFDLMVYLKPKIEPKHWRWNNNPYKSKFEACLLKAKPMVDYHPQLKQMVEEEEALNAKKLQAAQEKEEEESRQTAARLKKEVEALKMYDFKDGAFTSRRKRYGDAVSSVIKMFRLPSDKKDLLGLMEMLYPYSDKNYWKTGEGYKDKIGKTYMEKFEEVKQKVNELFPNDSDFAQFFPKKKGGLFGRFKG